MPRTKKVISVEGDQPVENTVPVETQEESVGKVYVYAAHGGVNGVPDGYTREFADKAEAEVWAKKYNGTLVE